MADFRTAAQGGRPRPQSFGEAFNEAKAGRKRVFEYPPNSGNMYTTETREERTQKAYSDTSRRREGEAAKEAQQAARKADARNTPTLRSLLGVAEPTSPTAQETMSRIASRPTSKSPEQERDEAKAKTIESLGLLATGGVGGLGRALAGRMMGRAASAPATTSRGALVRKTDEPPFKNADEVGSAAPASLPELGKGVFRSAREKAEAEARNAAPARIPELGRGVFRSAREKAEAEARNAKPRVQVEGTKGGAYRGAKDEKGAEAKPEFRSRTADRMDEMEMGMKKGGKVKAYAKGGSVRGAGIAQRGVKKCKVY